MIQLRPADARGPTDLGWLQSRHSFSFGGYFDPEHMGVSKLRVINDDRVAPGQGFAPHSHQDMEIISYVTEGTIEHRDSMGNIERVPAGEFQLMTAGTGVTHSEYNPSSTEALAFLQIWIIPERRGLQPAYQQQYFERRPGLVTVASPEGEGDAMVIHQDARLQRLILDHSQPDWTLSVQSGRTLYLHVVSGRFELADQRLGAGDGATVTQRERIDIAGEGEMLVFDLP